jgi:hypothetical protein
MRVFRGDAITFDNDSPQRALSPHTTLRLESRAILMGRPDIADYPAGGRTLGR